LPEKNEISTAGFNEKGWGVFAFYNIFGQSFEMSKQLMKRENEKDIRNTTVDSWDTNRGGAFRWNLSRMLI
jgi:hypothetical protein